MFSDAAFVFAVGVAQVVDFYLAEERAKERAEVVRLAGLEDDASRALLRGYVREAQRASLLPARMWSTMPFHTTTSCEKCSKIDTHQPLTVCGY